MLNIQKQNQPNFLYPSKEIHHTVGQWGEIPLVVRAGVGLNWTKSGGRIIRLIKLSCTPGCIRCPNDQTVVTLSAL